MIKIVTVLAIFGLILASAQDSNNTHFNNTDSNDTVPQDLYVIKTVVYEVGILTDPSNDTTNATTSDAQDRVDVSFYDPSLNDAAIDLSNIPVPLQTNVSSVQVTGFVPVVDLASILLPPNGNPVLPNKQVTVTQNFSTTNPEQGEQIIDNLPKLLGLTKRHNRSEEATKS